MAKRLSENHLNLGDLILASVMLAVALAVVSGLAGYVASLRVGQDAFAASALAAFVVWLAGSLSLMVTMRAPDNPSGVTALLLAMLLRIGLPLATVLLLTKLGSQAGGESPMGWAARLTEAGFFGLVVSHYLVALGIETILGVRCLSRRGCLSQQKVGSS